MSNFNNSSNTKLNTETLDKVLEEIKNYKQLVEEENQQVNLALREGKLDEAKCHMESISKSALESSSLLKQISSEIKEELKNYKQRKKEVSLKLKQIQNEIKGIYELSLKSEKAVFFEENYKEIFGRSPILPTWIFKLVLFCGVGWVFIYCFFYINYLPAISIENTLAFIFIALGFSIALGFIAGFLVLMWLVLVWIFKCILLKFKEKFNYTDPISNNNFATYLSPIILFIIIFLVFICLFLLKKIDLYHGLLNVLVFVWILLFHFMFFLGKKFRKSEMIITFIIGLCAFLPFISVLQKFSELDFGQFAMKQLGITHQNVSIELSEKDFNLIKNTAEEADIPVLFSCNESEKTIHGVDVLWHGLGDNTFIEVTSKEQEKENKTNNSQQGKQGKGKKYIRLELKSSENKIITLGNQTSAKGCIHAKLKNSFDKGKSEPSDKMTNELNDILKKVANNYAVKRLDVTGYADLSPYKGGNQQLSKQRADAVKSKIDEMKNGIQEIRNLEVYSIGGGNYHVDNKCNNPKLSEKDLEDCRMVDRGISLRFHVEQKKTNQGNQQDAQSKQQNN